MPDKIARPGKPLSAREQSTLVDMLSFTCIAACRAYRKALCAAASLQGAQKAEPYRKGCNDTPDLANVIPGSDVRVPISYVPDKK